jgi:hypothetical protein
MRARWFVLADLARDKSARDCPAKGSRDKRDRRDSRGQIGHVGIALRPLPKSLPISATKPVVLALQSPSVGFDENADFV